ncbi:MAG TPA: maleylpyruvate isomerase family mycothiol-dependent enzyme [Nocardioides sp.]|uniref:maleylpyruvate isomerase family mycothiol-dependent enzyme n=1 Tax=Nocardioides sp. TaxID=35761 RepID=UPI002C341568|nr:maleylpyruvate isomerase family mycothiol-dependent enzyme [Nocardioides sp.]HQR28239.1 maleylpyruvate isomerase family mycothiol-dependent enzyme [Nocardioides sp.]
MDRDEVWRTIDQQRRELAELMETFTSQEWETPSLCAGWRVRDVAAHLTLAQMRLRDALGPVVRARGSFNRMVHQTALTQAQRPVEEYPRLLRAMVGSRRTAPFVSEVEPMLDALVHGQDMVVPLGRTREMPPQAAITAAQRAWELNWPFGTKKRLRGFTLAATDQPWQAGEGPVVEATSQALLMLVTGRYVVLPELSGPGADALRARFPASAS